MSLFNIIILYRCQLSTLFMSFSLFKILLPFFKSYLKSMHTSYPYRLPHWLPMYQIWFLSLNVKKCLNDLSSLYLIYFSFIFLQRSADRLLLVVLITRQRQGNKTFSVVAPKFWLNCLLILERHHCFPFLFLFLNIFFIVVSPC